MPAPSWVNNGGGDEGPDYPPNPVDRVRIGGKLLPGICTVRALPTQVTDLQKPVGADSARLMLQGYLPGPIDIELFMWKRSQWDVWQKLLPLLWPKPGKLAPGSSANLTSEEDRDVEIARERREARQAAQLATQSAVEIEHPFLTPMNIHRVVVVGISLPEKGPQPQTWVVNIKCVEFVPPPPVVRKVTKVAGSNTKFLPVPSELGGEATKNAVPPPSATDGSPYGPPPPPNGPGGS